MTVSMSPNDILYYETESPERLKEFVDLVTKKVEGPPTFDSNSSAV